MLQNKNTHILHKNLNIATAYKQTQIMIFSF